MDPCHDIHGIPEMTTEEVILDLFLFGMGFLVGFLVVCAILR